MSRPLTSKRPPYPSCYLAGTGMRIMYVDGELYIYNNEEEVPVFVVHIDQLNGALNYLFQNHRPTIAPREPQHALDTP